MKALSTRSVRRSSGLAELFLQIAASAEPFLQIAASAEQMQTKRRLCKRWRTKVGTYSVSLLDPCRTCRCFLDKVSLQTEDPDRDRSRILGASY